MCGASAQRRSHTPMPTHRRLSVRVLNTRSEAFSMAHAIASSFMLTSSTHLTDFCQLASALEIAHAALGECRREMYDVSKLYLVDAFF